MSVSPLVSVVMGVYNGEVQLAATLDSVLTQAGVDLECLVVDDGSTDSTWALLQQRAAADPRLKPQRQARGGLTRALVAGCGLARGEFIARQDVGDISLPGRFAVQSRLLASRRELAFVACQFITVGPGGERMSGPEPADGGAAIIESLLTAAAEGMKGPHHGSVMFRRSAYEKVGGYRPEFYFAQDLDLWSRLIEVGSLGLVDEVLYQSRFAPGDLSARHRPQQMLLRDLIREATLCRREGHSEDALLQQAATVRGPAATAGKYAESRAEYFIGSCLLRRRDPAARRHLWRAVRQEPLHLKAWAKLIGSHVL